MTLSLPTYNAVAGVLPASQERLAESFFIGASIPANDGQPLETAPDDVYALEEAAQPYDIALDDYSPPIESAEMELLENELSGQIKPIVSEEAISLIAAIKTKGPQASLAYAELERSHEGLLHYFVRQHKNQNVCYEDLFQHARIGFWMGIERFKPEMGYKLSTYAGFWIRSQVQRCVIDMARTVRIPECALDDIRRLQRADGREFHENGTHLSDAQLAEHTNLAEPKVRELLDAAALKKIPIHRPIHRNQDDGPTLQDRLTGEPIDMEEIASARLQLPAFCRSLSPKLKRVIELRYGLEADSGNAERSLEDVGEVLGLTRERVRQLEVQAFDRLSQIVNRPAALKPYYSWLYDEAALKRIMSCLSEEEQRLFELTFTKWVTDTKCAEEMAMDERQIRKMRKYLEAKIDAAYEAILKQPNQRPALDIEI